MTGFTGEERFFVTRPVGAGGTVDQEPITLDELIALVPDSGGGGGGGAGNTIVRKFPFAFDTPNILTGAALYTPTVGDILLDAWIEIDTAWDGTSPLGDVGVFHSGQGWCQWSGQGPLDMGNADVDNSNIDGIIGNGGAWTHVAQSVQTNFGTGTRASLRCIPGRFDGTPIDVVVSQDGTNTGADPGSTVGSAVLYLVTATPI